MSGVATGRLPRLLVAGDPRHGVVRYAREVAEAIAALTGSAYATPETGGGGPLHVHFTDRLWGPTPTNAADAFERLAAATPVTVTLHDLPQPSDGPASLGRRATAYGRVAAAARAVAVNSTNEAVLLGEWTSATAVAPVVIPHPVDPVTPLATSRETDDEVALLGFVYPGKGHAEAIDAVATAGLGMGVTALGGPAAGHQSDVDALHAHAAAAGVRLTVTGYLADDELLTRCRGVAIPLAAHRHVSASGSIATWIAAGRRPLLPENRHSREVAALRPDGVTVYADLHAALERARRDPVTTWWPAEADLGPNARDVAGAYLRWWAEDVPW